MDAQQQMTELLQAIKKAHQSPIPEAIAKAWVQSNSPTTGITAYDLEAPAKTLYPVLTPLRNMIPRDFSGTGTQANWKAITAINTAHLSAGTGFGQRAGVISTSVADYAAAYKAIGLEDYVEWEADYAAKGFDDVKARAVQGLLRSMMIQEEKIILGGNSTLELGTTATPTLSAFTTGGALADATYSVICVALTFEGFHAASVAGGIPHAVARTNADGTTANYKGGSAQKSANATVAVSGGSGAGRVTATVAAKRGAVGYAWFWGAAGSEVLGAVTTINSVVITAAAAGTQTAASVTAADHSFNTLVFDGILTHVFKSQLNSYFKQMATGTAGVGTPLTATGDGGVVEIEEALQHFWDQYKLSPTEIRVGTQEQRNITSKVLMGAANSAQRIVINEKRGELGGGVMVRSYLNRYSMDGANEIPVKLHPNMPNGTILFMTTQLPYPLSNVTDVLKVKGRRDYHQLEWPLRTRRYEYGVYSDEVLQNYFPPAFGVITGIGNG